MSEYTQISQARFEILKKLAFEEKSSSELASELKFSIPYIHQQVTLLEAQGYLNKKILRTGNAGKPKQIYTVAQETANISIMKKGFAAQFNISKEEEMTTYLQIISLIPSNSYVLFSKYYWKNVECIKKLTSLALIFIDDSKIELFGIASAEDVKKLREKISNVKLKDCFGVERTIVCWINTFEECLKGLDEKDPYYLSHLTRSKKLFDNENNFAKLKEKI